MIIQCSNCSTKLKVPDSSAGKKAKCPKCANIVDVVPANEVSTDKPRFKPLTDKPAAKKASSTSPAPRPAKKKATASSAPDRRSASDRPVKKKPAAKKRPAKKRRPKKKKDTYDDAYGFDDLSSYGEPHDDYGDAEDYDDNPYSAPAPSGGGRRQRSRGSGGVSSAGLSTVGTGLMVVAWGIVAIVAGVGAGLLMGLVSGNPAIGLLAFGLFLVGGGLASLVGQCMCLAAPSESGARGLLITALVCQLGQFITNVMIRMGPAGPADPMLMIARGLCSIGFGLFFLLFLKKIAQFSRHDDHASKATGILIGAVICSVIIVLSTIIVRMAPAAAGIGLIAMSIAGIGILILAVLQVSLLFRLGSALRNAKGGSSAAASIHGGGRRSRSSSRGRHVQFSYTISIVVMTFKMNSAPVYVAKGEGTFMKGLPYTLISLVLGWWGIPWGPIYTITSIIQNSSGGIEAD